MFISDVQKIYLLVKGPSRHEKIKTELVLINLDSLRCKQMFAAKWKNSFPMTGLVSMKSSYITRF